MSYKGIPDDELADQKEKVILPAAREKEATEELLKRLPKAAVYGFLLSADPKHPIAEVVRTRWSELHHLSGEQFVLVAFDPPAEWASGIEDYWRQQLGGDFDAVWTDWKQRRGLETGAAFSYLDLFSTRIKATDLPCLALFTSPDSREAVVRSIPNWDADSLYKFLLAQFDEIRDCCATPQDQRLECLRKSLTSPSARAQTYLGHVAGEMGDYLKQHPAQVISSSLSMVVALATANVLPLAGPALSTIKAIKDVYFK